MLLQISEPVSANLAIAAGIKDVYCLQLNSPVFLEQLFSNKMGNPDIVSDNKQGNESFWEFQQRLPNSHYASWSPKVSTIWFGSLKINHFKQRLIVNHWIPIQTNNWKHQVHQEALFCYFKLPINPDQIVCFTFFLFLPFPARA